MSDDMHGNRWLTLVCCLLAACAGTAESRSVADAEIASGIAQAWRDHIAAAQRKDLAGVLALYTDDVVYAVEGTPLRQGRAALAAVEQEGLTAIEVVRAEHATTALQVSDLFVFELGTVAGDVAAAGETPRHMVFRYAAKWQRGDDGRWRIAHLTGRGESARP